MNAIGRLRGSTAPVVATGRYAAGSWAGKPRWKCPHCPWTTLIGPDAVDQHLEGHWAELPPSPLLGPDGRPLY